MYIIVNTLHTVGCCGGDGDINNNVPGNKMYAKDKTLCQFLSQIPVHFAVLFNDTVGYRII